MQQDYKFWIPFLAAVSAIIVAAIASHFGGFLGITIAGLLITTAALRYDLEKNSLGSGFPTATLYRRQMEARAQMSRDEEIAHKATLHALWRPIFIAKTIGIGLIGLGLGGYFLT